MYNRPLPLQDLYNESDKDILFFLANYSDGYLSRIVDLEQRNLAGTKITEFLNNTSPKLKVDRWSINVIATEIVRYSQESEPLLDCHPDTDKCDQLRQCLQQNNEYDTVVRELQNNSLTTRIQSLSREAYIQKSNVDQLDRSNRPPTYHSFYFQQIITNAITVRVTNSSTVNLLNNSILSKVLQNERILEIGNKPKSKVSFIFHDILDHLITFDILEKKYIFEKHIRFFSKLGNPCGDNFFHRESELIAAISYARRQFILLNSHPSYSSFCCNIDFVSYIESRIETASRYDPNNYIYNEVLAYFNDSNFDSALLQHVIANVILEAEELQRKHGFSLIFKNGDFAGRFDPWDVDHLCLICDCVKKINSAKYRDYKFDSIAANLAVLVEDELRMIILENTKNDFNLIIENIGSIDTTKLPSQISEDVKNLLRKYCHFSTFIDFNFPS